MDYQKDDNVWWITARVKTGYTDEKTPALFDKFARGEYAIIRVQLPDGTWESRRVKLSNIEPR